jgi:hypothetical protein
MQRPDQAKNKVAARETVDALPGIVHIPADEAYDRDGQISERTC